MRNYKLKYFILCAVLFTVFACKKEKIFVYEQNSGIYFGQSTFSYTFIDNPGSLNKTIKLPVIITGDAAEHDREFVISIPKGDTITTAEERMYRIGKGLVKAGEFEGTVEIELNYYKELDDSVYKLRLEILPSNDFPEIRLNRTYMTLSFTNRVIQPANWSWLRWYFGTPYSTRWWKFIMEKTERTSLPYFPTNADKETWWMSVGEVQAYASLVKIELEKYNSAHPNDPLTHDDGQYAGTPVTMP